MLAGGKDRNGGNGYFPAEEAEYSLKIGEIKGGEFRNGKAYIVGLDVVASSTPGVMVGGARDWYVSLATPMKVGYAIPDIRNFIQAVFKLVTDAEKKSFDEPFEHEGKKYKSRYDFIWESSQSDAQPLKGRPLHLRTKRSENGFTKHFFSPPKA